MSLQSSQAQCVANNTFVVCDPNGRVLQATRGDCAVQSQIEFMEKYHLSWAQAEAQGYEVYEFVPVSLSRNLQ